MAIIVIAMKFVTYFLVAITLGPGMHMSFSWICLFTEVHVCSVGWSVIQACDFLTAAFEARLKGLFHLQLAQTDDSHFFKFL
jgi:hypothetical protein